MTCDVSDFRVDLPGLSIAGLRFITGDNPLKRKRVLAVHGWLDNANSFVPLAPLLDDIDLIAIDLPGHGLSGHLPSAATYHFIDTPDWVFQVADAVDWSTFHWLGHSLGGCLAPFAAVSKPSQLQSIILLEASGPLTEIPSKLPERLQKSSAEKQNHTKFESRLLPSIKDAVAARLRATHMTEPAAQLIVERQLKSVEGGFHWRFDPRHRMTSPNYLTEQQVHAVLGSVECPTLFVSAKDGYMSRRPDTQPRLSCVANAIHHQVNGHHHMHMDDPKPTAEVINEFYQDLP